MTTTKNSQESYHRRQANLLLFPRQLVKVPEQLLIERLFLLIKLLVILSRSGPFDVISVSFITNLHQP